MGTVPGSHLLVLGWVGWLPTGLWDWQGEVAQSPEVSLSGGAGCSWGSCWDVQPGAGQPWSVWSGSTPVAHTLQLCSHMKIPARSDGCSGLSWTLSLPMAAP